MKSRKGQITLFVIAGLVLLLLITFMIVIRFYLASEEAREQVVQTEKIPADVQEIEAFVRRCIRSVSIDGLTLLGKQAGYTTIPEIIRKKDTAYWHLDEINIQPTLSQTKTQLEQYIDRELEKCLDFSIIEQEKNLKVISKEHKTHVSFGAQDVNVQVLFPIDITRQNLVTHYDEFTENFDVQWRRLYELATQVNMRQLEAQFKFSEPLVLVEQASFDMAYVTDGESIIYTITDRTTLENGKPFSLTFASRLLNSDLRRVILLQNNSRTVPSILPYIVYSIDHRAQLYIYPGTTAALQGKDVYNITVGQTYPGNVTRENVPYHEGLDDEIKTQNISWILTYPLYHFDPTGLRFNRPQRLVLYWDEDRVPHKGNMGILYDEGQGWRPLPSITNYEQHYVYTDIPGFSSYTPVDCAYQPAKEITVYSDLDPNADCVGKLILIVVIIIIIIIIIILSLGTASPAAAGAGAAVSGGSTVAPAAGAPVVLTTAVGESSALTGGVLVGGTPVAAGAPIAAGSVVTIPAGSAIQLGAATTGTLAAGSGTATVASAGLTSGILSSAVLGSLAQGGVTGVASGALALVSTFSVGNLVLIGFVVTGSLVGGAYINSGLSYSSSPGEDTIVFTPTCDQQIVVSEDTSGGSGMCIPEGVVGLTGPQYETKNNRTRLIKAGVPEAVKAVTKKCTGSRRFWCQGCSTQCTTKFV